VRRGEARDPLLLAVVGEHDDVFARSAPGRMTQAVFVVSAVVAGQGMTGVG